MSGSVNGHFWQGFFYKRGMWCTALMADKGKEVAYNLSDTAFVVGDDTEATHVCNILRSICLSPCCQLSVNLFYYARGRFNTIFGLVGESFEVRAIFESTIDFAS